MPRILTKALGTLAAGMLLPIAAQAVGGVANSSHNFAGIGNPQTGLCTFCHTPHRALQQALLWNHRASANQSFSWSPPNVETAAGTVYPVLQNTPADTYTGPTVKCLSCHDGSVAVGDVGWWLADGPLNAGDNSRVGGAYQVGAGGDLTGNHPVAMPYPYKNVRNTYNNTTTGTAIKLPDWQPDPQTLNIVLYHDAAGTIVNGAADGTTGMECGSCHDVHNGPNVLAGTPYLLYGTVGGQDTNYICLKCHIK